MSRRSLLPATLAAGALLALVAGCGNKGPLVLPPGSKGTMPDLTGSTPLAPSVPILQPGPPASVTPADEGTSKESPSSSSTPLPGASTPGSTGTAAGTSGSGETAGTSGGADPPGSARTGRSDDGGDGAPR
jgi:predicted small lipoprotein YifL